MSEETPSSPTSGAESASPVTRREADDERPHGNKVRKRRRRRRVRQGLPAPRSIFQNKVVLAICAIALLFLVLLVVIPRLEGNFVSPPPPPIE